MIEVAWFIIDSSDNRQICYVPTAQSLRFALGVPRVGYDSTDFRVAEFPIEALRILLSLTFLARAAILSCQLGISNQIVRTRMGHTATPSNC